MVTIPLHGPVTPGDPGELSDGVSSVRCVSVCLASRTYGTMLWAHFVALLPVQGREQVDAAVSEYVTDLTDELAARSRAALPARVRRALAEARSQGSPTALLAVAALTGDADAVRSVRLLADEPVSPSLDDLQLRQREWISLKSTLLSNGMRQQQWDELKATGRFTDAVENRVPLARQVDEQRCRDEQQRAPRVVALMRELLCLVRLLTELEISKPQHARELLTMVHDFQRLLTPALRVLGYTDLPPPWLPEPRMKLAGAVQQCAPPAPVADVSPLGHAAAVAA
jgi:hypothetical protein